MLKDKSVMKIIILALLLVTKKYPASQASSLTSVIKFEQCQADNLGHVFLVGKDVSLRKCAAHCSKKDWCQGLAFGKNLMLCSLYNNMTSWEKMQSTRGDCAVIYKENLTGINFADFELEELNECDEFVTVANGIVHGNMNREGNRKQVVCKQGFKIQNGSDVSQCRNGTWAPKPTCVPECRFGWQKHGTSCYLVFTNYSTDAYVAQTFCASVGAKLMTTTTQDDKNSLSSIAGNTGIYTWTGLQMEGGRVTDTYTNTTVSIQNWCNGPSTSVNMTCMAVAHDTKLMYASCVFIYACHFPLKTVCKQPFGT